MRITVLGTGMVGRTLAARLSGLGHDVVIGTRDVDRTLARTESDAMGTVPYPDWQNDHPAVGLVLDRLGRPRTHAAPRPADRPDGDRGETAPHAGMYSCRTAPLVAVSM